MLNQSQSLETWPQWGKAHPELGWKVVCSEEHMIYKGLLGGRKKSMVCNIVIVYTVWEVNQCFLCDSTLQSICSALTQTIAPTGVQCEDRLQMEFVLGSREGPKAPSHDPGARLLWNPHPKFKMNPWTSSFLSAELTLFAGGWQRGVVSNHTGHTTPVKSSATGVDTGWLWDMEKHL